MRKQILLIGIVLGLIILVSDCARKSEQVLNQEVLKALDQKNYKEAINIYSQLIRSYPKSQDAPKAYFNLGMVYFANLNDLNKAEQVWERLARGYPGFDLEREFFAYAQEIQDQKDAQLAIKIYEEILRYFPASANRDKASFLIGFVYSEQLKDYPKAKEAFEKFLKDYPQSDLRDDAEYMLNNLGKEPEFEKTK
ncbi:MAG TPA: tetratricopeptide repeat protein [Terriglobales bacterium]|nr:tetratricopeptide repeat protein [Terriglobales bacterium]